MALHEIPDDGHEHETSRIRPCECGVTARRGMYRGEPRYVYVHRALTSTPVCSSCGKPRERRTPGWPLCCLSGTYGPPPEITATPTALAGPGDDHDETYGGTR